MPTEILIALQLVIGIVNTLANGHMPTPEQIAALNDAETAIKAKLDADLAKVAAGQ